MLGIRALGRAVVGTLPIFCGTTDLLGRGQERQTVYKVLRRYSDSIQSGGRHFHRQTSFDSAYGVKIQERLAGACRQSRKKNTPYS
jgi:hypothetical protein